MHRSVFLMAMASAGSMGCGDLETVADAEVEALETPPGFLSSGANRSSLSEGQAMRIVALVTDPLGIDALISGELLLGPISLGAFATGAREGAYEISISLQELQDARAIEFTYGGTEDRGLTARFVDQAGHDAARDLTLTLTRNAEAACNGACVDTVSDPNSCGACGGVCGAYSRGECPACLTQLRAIAHRSAVIEDSRIRVAPRPHGTASNVRGERSGTHAAQSSEAYTRTPCGVAADQRSSLLSDLASLMVIG